MADIFISYSKQSKAETEQLATELQAKGFSVWYDTSLVPGDSFRDVIISELAQARAAIVIWTADSVKSDWVCAEASRARARGILVPVRADDVRSHDIPLPFGTLHTDLLSNRSAIEAALAKLGVIPKLATTDEMHAPPAMVGDDARPALALPDKPSIAVLPFRNMSGDPEQEYFADGIVEDITTALSRFKALFVIARNSSFTYKGRAVDVKQVGRELGVRYVLEGSVRKAADRVRITGQLVDTATGAHLWADRIDGALSDIFELQDRVTESVAWAIAPAMQQAEIKRANRKPTESLDAYALYLRGLAWYYQYGDREALDEALRLFNSATKLDPDFAAAYSYAASCYSNAKSHGWFSNTAEEIVEASRLARRAIEVGKDDAVALARGGWVLAHVARDLCGGASLIEHALVLNSNLAEAWQCGGWIKNWLGEPEVAIERFAHVMRLDPLGPNISGNRTGTAHAHFFLGRYAEAASWAGMALQYNSDFQPGLRISAASNAMGGQLEQAHTAVARLRQLSPALRVSNLKDVIGPFRIEDLSRFEEGLRRAGLPE
jgi:TolB-like protein